MIPALKIEGFQSASWNPTMACGEARRMAPLPETFTHVVGISGIGHLLLVNTGTTE
jgi:hypothetical protein